MINFFAKVRYILTGKSESAAPDPIALDDNAEILAAIRENDKERVKQLAPNSRIYGIPISEIINIEDQETDLVQTIDTLLRDPDQAIYLAAKNGNTKVVRSLLADKRINPSVYDDSAICWAVSNGHETVVELLLGDKRVNPAVNNNYVMNWAISKGQAKIVKRLLADKRVNPAANNNQALYDAVSHGHEAVVKLLLEDRRIDPTTDDNYALNLAVNYGHGAVVKLLLADGRAKLHNPKKVDDAP